MAFFDDPRFIINHIRNSYITSDDTGMCEMVMLNEDFPSKKILPTSLQPSWAIESSDSGLESDGAELSQSFDIASDMDYALRRRSNTAQRLERLKKEKKNQAKIKSIQWKENPDPINSEEISELFEKKLPTTDPKPKKSLLSEQLMKFPTLPNNPFSEYAKFDGNANFGVPTRKINIFLTMLPPDERQYPMTVVTIASAKVQDLIGLICWQYTNEAKEPKLKDNVEFYSLHIAEDDGEVDIDFPSLDPKEVISRFGFSILALVEKSNTDSLQDNQIVVTVIIPQGGFSKIPVDSTDVPMKTILEKTMRRRKGMIKSKARRIGIEYQLEKRNQPGVPVPLDDSLASMDTMEFFLVRANSKRIEPTVEFPEDDMEMIFRPHFEKDKDMDNLMEAPLWQSYRVFHIHKFTKTEIHLGVSGEKIEIDPVQQKNKIFLARQQKAVTLDIDVIAACEILDLKSTGKSAFRLTYKSGNNHDFKHHDFEADSHTAKKIVQKVNHIVEMRSSNVHREYNLMRERKFQAKKKLPKTTYQRNYLHGLKIVKSTEHDDISE